MSRLSWFPFYVDDFLGGTMALSAAECGRYLLCLASQWSSAERRAIPADPAALRLICKGDDPGPRVLAKFERLDVEGEPSLRNKRLSDEWGKASVEYNGRRKGAERTNERTAQRNAQPPAQRYTLDKEQSTKNNVQETTTKQKRNPPAAASPTVSAPTWNGEAALDWQAAYGGDPLDVYFGEVKKLVRKFTWERVRPVLRYYMAETAVEYVNLSRLRSGFGQWEARSRGGVVSAKARQHEDSLLAFIQGGKREGRILGSGNGVVDGQPSAEGHDTGGDVPKGRYLPPGTARSDG